MSADNWGICPVCHPNGEIDEFEHTLREDYEQAMLSSGEYYVIYRCRCDACKFQFEFKHSEQATKNCKPRWTPPDDLPSRELEYQQRLKGRGIHGGCC